MRKNLMHTAIAAALLLGATAACAAEPPHDQTIDAGDAEQSLAQSWTLAADARIEIDNVRGSVSVSGWDQPQAQLSGSLGNGSKLVVSGDAQHLLLKVEAAGKRWFGGNGPDSDSDLVLKVPHGAALKVGVVSADARVSGVTGKSLDVSGVSGKLMLTADAPQIDVNSVSGDVVLVTAHSGNSDRAHLQTVSGDISARGLAGRVKLETVSGEIGLDGGQVQELETGTVSGDARLTVTPAPHARFAMESMSGDIRLHVPASLSAHLEAETFSGDIHTDFGHVRDKERGSGTNLDARVGDGDGQIKAQSFSGDIELRKQ